MTIKNEVKAVGIGLHSGKPVTMKLKPAMPNSGIVFVRTDLNGALVKADMKHIDFAALQLATTLRDGEVVVQTTEHLLSALYGMGVDNVTVELDGPEVPIMDGSAAPFMVLLEEAGIKQQVAPRKVLQIKKAFSFVKDGKMVAVKPGTGFQIDYEIDFDHPMIGRQVKSVQVDDRLYENEIAPARTFGFLKDLTYLKSLGLIQGGSLDNAVVLDDERILNKSLRAKDEFVSHKILDMVGDLAVAGYRFEGHFSAAKAGHEMHALFLQALLASPEHYRIIDAKACENAAAPRLKPVAVA